MAAWRMRVVRAGSVKRPKLAFGVDCHGGDKAAAALFASTPTLAADLGDRDSPLACVVLAHRRRLVRRHGLGIGWFVRLSVAPSRIVTRRGWRLRMGR
jgi:hypothetical protein